MYLQTIFRSLLALSIISSYGSTIRAALYENKEAQSVQQQCWCRSCQKLPGKPRVHPYTEEEVALARALGSLPLTRVAGGENDAYPLLNIILAYYGNKEWLDMLGIDGKLQVRFTQPLSVSWPTGYMVPLIERFVPEGKSTIFPLIPNEVLFKEEDVKLLAEFVKERPVRYGETITLKSIDGIFKVVGARINSKSSLLERKCYFKDPTPERVFDLIKRAKRAESTGSCTIL